MSVYRKIIPQYYDMFMGDEKGIIQPLKKLLKKHHIRPKNILELACGTGTILSVFPKKISLSGLDISEGMLRKARKKIPHATFYPGDMAEFSLGKNFDLILCMFDSINELTQIQQWQSMFACVSSHLQKGGYFIFDMNSFERLRYLSDLHVMYGYQSGKNFVLSQMVKTKRRSLVDITFRFLIHKKKNLYQLEEDHIYEAGFALEKVTQKLRKYFVVKDVLKIRQELSNPESTRIFFVCKKIRE